LRGHFRLIFVIGSLVFLISRLRGADTPNQVGLGLLIEAQSISGGTPQAFAFSILNKTDHDIHLPNPTIDCLDPFDGMVSLNVKFHCLTPGDEMGEGVVVQGIGWAIGQLSLRV
jgi:hypothetical protein